MFITWSLESKTGEGDIENFGLLGIMFLINVLFWTDNTVGLEWHYCHLKITHGMIVLFFRILLILYQDFLLLCLRKTRKILNVCLCCWYQLLAVFPSIIPVSKTKKRPWNYVLVRNSLQFPVYWQHWMSTEVYFRENKEF